jgi:hypothetical protein
MAKQGESAAYGAPVLDEIVAEDLGLTRDHGQQAGAGPKDAGLAGTVGTLQQHDLPPRRVEVDAGEGRKGPEQGDGRAEADGRGHVDVTNATGSRSNSSI